MTKDEMVGWHHQLNAHFEFEQALGDNEGQESLACFSPKVMQRVRHNLATKQQQKEKKCWYQKQYGITFANHP